MDSNTLCLLAVNNEETLKALADRATREGFSVSRFYEPDRENELTAIALEPAAKRICKGLDLALA